MLLAIIMKLRIILQNIWWRVVGNVLINVSPSNTLFFLQQRNRTNHQKYFGISILMAIIIILRIILQNICSRRVFGNVLIYISPNLFLIMFLSERFRQSSHTYRRRILNGMKQKPPVFKKMKLMGAKNVFRALLFKLAYICIFCQKILLNYSVNTQLQQGFGLLSRALLWNILYFSKNECHPIWLE